MCSYKTTEGGQRGKRSLTCSVPIQFLHVEKEEKPSFASEPTVGMVRPKK